jgi:non-specific serine/threonine protein kinase
LTPHGRLVLMPADDAIELEPGLARRLQDAFARGAGHGLLQLGAAEVGHALPPVFSYWREFGTRYVTAVCTQPDVAARSAKLHVPIPADEQLDQLAAAAPLMPGSEYLTVHVLRALWEELDAAFRSDLSAAALPLQEFLRRLNQAWNLVGRVHFNLAENRKDDQAPFAFLATYTTRLSAHGKAQHQPLGQALREYAGVANKQQLLSLLIPVQRAAESCAWLRAMVDAGEIFHPLRWTPREALELLTDVPLLEQSGVVVRMPATWKAGRPSRPQATATVGGTKPAGLGKDALLDFQLEVTLDGESLTAREIQGLLSCSDGLALIRGRWVEVDRDRLERMMEKFRQVEKLTAREGLSFAEAMRMLAGANVAGDGGGDRTDADWSRVVAGPWLAETLKALRSPEGLARVELGPDLHATLRPYQHVGVRWLHLLSRLGIGARLDEQPGLLFKLREVNEQDLIARAGADLPLSKKGPAANKLLVADGLSDIFGLDMAEEVPSSAASRAPKKSVRRTGAKAVPAKKPDRASQAGGKKHLTGTKKKTKSAAKKRRLR